MSGLRATQGHRLHGSRWHSKSPWSTVHNILKLEGERGVDKCKAPNRALHCLWPSEELSANHTSRQESRDAQSRNLHDTPDPRCML